MELIGAFLTGVVGPLLYLLINKYIEKKKDKKRDKIKESLSSTCVINEELEEMREEFNSDRVWISQFHNGGNFYPTGKSIQKFSIFYEVTKIGVSTISHVFSNIPTSLYSSAFEHMLNGEKRGIFIPDFYEKDAKTFSLRAAAESVGTKSSYVLPLYSLDEKFIGTIGIDYVGRKRRMTKDEWEHFQIKAGRIAGYLSNHLQEN
jgi:hypothetical protein